MADITKRELEIPFQVLAEGFELEKLVLNTDIMNAWDVSKTPQILQPIVNRGIVPFFNGLP